jgi:hypothetical protein
LSEPAQPPPPSSPSPKLASHFGRCSSNRRDHFGSANARLGLFCFPHMRSCLPFLRLAPCAASQARQPPDKGPGAGGVGLIWHKLIWHKASQPPLRALRAASYCTPPLLSETLTPLSQSAAFIGLTPGAVMHPGPRSGASAMSSQPSAVGAGGEGNLEGVRARSWLRTGRSRPCEGPRRGDQRPPTFRRGPCRFQRGLRSRWCALNISGGEEEGAIPCGPPLADDGDVTADATEGRKDSDDQRAIDACPGRGSRAGGRATVTRKRWRWR